MHLASLLTLSAIALSIASALGDNQQTIYQRGYLSKEDALKSIEVPEGFKLQLVLSDPVIKEPVAVAWDGNGVMYVAEMRTYMQDADARGEQTPRSRISRHENTDGDGVYDKHSVFIDNILLPRMILPLDDRVMVGITNTLDLWNYRDTDGDGVADEKIKIHTGGRRGGNMEHQPSGLVWGLDNWIYLTYENIRYRYTDGKLITERIPNGSGQWGLTEDDDGRLYYSAAGGEVPAYGFQQPPVYGLLNLSGQLAGDFKLVHPIALVPDVQGGPGRVGKNGGLNHFTGCAGQEIYRGNALPADLYGDLFIPEPVGRLIRRAKVNRSAGKTVLTNATPGSEFIRTRDINFRPVQTQTGPDGCLYIVDMHRGIIQQGNWTRPGSYLRGIIDKWGLAKNIGHGRIYRLVHKDHQPGPRPGMLAEKTTDLVKHLAHPNAWWRNTARKLIILRKDRDQAVPALEALASNQKQPLLARVTALWTLEGMSAVKPGLLTTMLGESHPRILTAAIRIAEKHISLNNTEVITAVHKLRHSTNAEVVLQLCNSINHCGIPAPLADAKATLVKNNAKLEALRTNEAVFRKRAADIKRIAEERSRNAQLSRAVENGRLIYSQLCHECHGENGTGTPLSGGAAGLTLAPSLSKNPRVNGSGEALIRILLHGMQGPISGKTYSAGIMPPQKSNDDPWIADVATYIRNSFGNQSPQIHPQQVATIRKQTAKREQMWTQKELDAIEPPELMERHKWKLTASNGGDSCALAVDGQAATRFTTNALQRPGMWLQIELPRSRTLSRVLLDHQASASDHPRGYTISLSEDGKKWLTTKPLAGSPSSTTQTFPPRKARFVKITLTEAAKSHYWSIHELHLFGQ
ncbi:MAG: discoidin domain-containing protein [Akkermansiaceae bacterium]|nr:discoidin domain-containing protein [Akkermansiaceae bacterium]